MSYCITSEQERSNSLIKRIHLICTVLPIILCLDVFVDIELLILKIITLVCHSIIVLSLMVKITFHDFLYDAQYAYV